MQTRRDQLQAYQFLVRRILAALLGNEPEAPEQPMRRVKAATFSGIMLGALACGGVALTGFLTNSSSDGWQDEVGSLIVDKDTKTLYFYEQPNGKKTLFPVLNRTSAQLYLGNAEPNMKEVPSQNLEGVPRGPEAGIPGIPSALPGPDSVTEGPWLFCNHMPSADRRLADLFIDKEPPDGSTELGERAVIVRDDAGQLYLVWNGARFAADEDALVSLSLDPQDAIRVAPAWLNALPQGEDLKPIPPPGLGDPGVTVTNIPDTRVGQVFQVSADNTYWVMYSDGLVRTTETQARLLLGSVAEDANGAQQEATPIGVQSVNNVRSPETAPIPKDQPADVPEGVDVPDQQAPLCLSYAGDPEAALTVSAGGSVPRSNAEQATGGKATGPTADRVTVPGGKVAIIATLGADGKASGHAVVIDGLKFPVPSREVLNNHLGYADVTPMPVPKTLADLIRSGPALDPADAGLSVLGQSGGESAEEEQGN